MVNLEELDQVKITEFLKLHTSKNKFVITPSSILKNMGFPVSEHKFMLENKSTILKLKKILAKLNKEGVLSQRKLKQDFKGIKEIGYDYVIEN
ncbi:hypothetical protein [Chryseobacterium sp. ISL-6]|uniref:hypothetical protein n=1 Tax=Chryseobacterium sp. ISL-6 TaxID=2819143 RepID=UPI001BE7CD17|nr:hypothetical protein [Chryseobacterium sp. ISL-6]MBT2620358.1 hypothetical protein [Chryseobacterium sp. ISL-6]